MTRGVVVPISGWSGNKQLAFNSAYIPGWREGGRQAGGGESHEVRGMGKRVGVG